jgi:hypothetical protein
MKMLTLLSVLIALPSICQATTDTTWDSTEVGTQIVSTSLDGRSERSPLRPTFANVSGAGAVILLSGAELMPSLGNGIPYPAFVEPGPGGQIAIRGGEIRLSAGEGSLPPSVSAIPEPKGYAMLLSGLVVIAGLMTRRK